MEHETAPLDPAMKALAEREEALEIVSWLIGRGGLQHSPEHSQTVEQALAERIAAGTTIDALRDEYLALSPA